MNKQIAIQRLNEVVMVDSTNSNNADFLLTHVPFDYVLVKKGCGFDQSNARVGEEELFSRLFNDSKNREMHQFVVVEGSNGTGKSHFIRWVYAKLAQLDDQKDVVILIKREDNTLKGTLSQLLKLKEVEALHEKDYYQRLLKANECLGQEELKSKIYFSLLNAVNNEIRKRNDLSLDFKKRLLPFLEDAVIKDRLSGDNGPIIRIYNKIENNCGFSGDEPPRFIKEDFILTDDIVNRINEVGNQYAIYLASELIPDESGEFAVNPEEIADFLNPLVNGIIRDCIGIQTGDFSKVFREIRKELKRQGKGLILLIEDITAFTGIDSDLLDALIVEHTGLNQSETLCRLISVVGSTSQFYDTFRDNFKDRITAEIKLPDCSISKNIEEFFARYLNAISLSETEVNEWYQNGADPSQIPIYSSENELTIDSYMLNGDLVNLFPFSKRSIHAMIQGLQPVQSPREILMQIFVQGVRNYLFKPEEFMRFSEKLKMNNTDDLYAQIWNHVRLLALNADEKNFLMQRALRFVYFYSPTTYVHDTNHVFSINRQVWDCFGMSDLQKSFSSNGDKVVVECPPSDPIVEKNPPKVKETAYDRYYKNLREWRDNGQVLQCRFFVPALEKLIASLFPIDNLGISHSYLANFENFHFEIERGDKRIGQGGKNGVMKLNANHEVYNLLLAALRYEKSGQYSFDYEGAYEDMYNVTKWIQDHLVEVKNIITEEREVTKPEYIRAAMVLDTLKKALNGTKSPVHLSTKWFTCSEVSGPQNLEGHCDEWKRMAQGNALQSDYCKIYRDFYSFAQGASQDKRFYDTHGLALAVKSLEKEGVFFNASVEYIGNKQKNIISDYNKAKINIISVLNEENDRAKYLLDKIYLAFGFEMDADIDENDLECILNQFQRFYKALQGQEFYRINRRYDEIEACRKKKKSICTSISEVRKVVRLGSVNESNALLFLNVYSGQTLSLMSKLMDLFTEMETDISFVKQIVDKKMDEIGNTPEVSFVGKMEELNKLCNEKMKELDNGK